MPGWSEDLKKSYEEMVDCAANRVPVRIKVNNVWKTITPVSVKHNNVGGNWYGGYGINVITFTFTDTVHMHHDIAVREDATELTIQNYFLPSSASITPSIETPAIKCTCGIASVGAGIHSDWCVFAGLEETGEKRRFEEGVKRYRSND